jgi:E3 ubiquitin-protein ligase RNF115/126
MCIFKKRVKILPIIFPDKGNKYLEKKCIICTIIFNNNYVTLPCGHIFHSECILQWISKKQTCPVCRMKLSWTKRQII